MTVLELKEMSIGKSSIPGKVGWLSTGRVVQEILVAMVLEAAEMSGAVGS